jgi:hypothetical protein
MEDKKLSYSVHVHGELVKAISCPVGVYYVDLKNHFYHFEAKEGLDRKHALVLAMGIAVMAANEGIKNGHVVKAIHEDFESLPEKHLKKEGDKYLYDFYIRNDQLFFCIGDVSGKGVPASLVMAVSRSLFRIVSTHVNEPDRIMSQMNEALADQNDSSMFVTLFVGSYNLKTGLLKYCNGGHDAPLLVNVKEKRTELLPCVSNLPVGVMPGWEFEMQEAMISSGTLIFMYTDGLPEAENVDQEQFTESRMFEVADQLLEEKEVTPELLIERMSDAVRHFVGDAEQSDDLTMLAIKRR